MINNIWTQTVYIVQSVNHRGIQIRKSEYINIVNIRKHLSKKNMWKVCVCKQGVLLHMLQGEICNIVTIKTLNKSTQQGRIKYI